MKERPLFIPLKTEFFLAFKSGSKKHEYRLYGPRWNERTCRVGRAVVLSKGYGKHERLCGTVKSFTKHAEPPKEQCAALERCFGQIYEPIADIEIEVSFRRLTEAYVESRAEPDGAHQRSDS